MFSSSTKIRSTDKQSRTNMALQWSQASDILLPMFYHEVPDGCPSSRYHILSSVVSKGGERVE